MTYEPQQRRAFNYSTPPPLAKSNSALTGSTGKAPAKSVPREIDADTSRRITALRFLLAVLVVFIHNNYTDGNVADILAATGRVIVFNQSAFGACVQTFISDGIARCAVPLFFLFAAFLQAKKADPYPALLKKKAKSLLLPYVLWMAIYFFCRQILISKMNLLPQLLGKNRVVATFNWTVADWIQQFLGYTAGGGASSFPGLAMHFWFVRDLLVLAVLSPAIVALIKKAPAAAFGMVAGVYLLNLPVYFVATEGLFWYIAGLLWGINEAPLLQAIDRIRWGEAALLFIVTFCCNHIFYGGEGTSRRLMVIAMCVLMLKASKLIAQNERAFALAERLSRYSFFLFAIHVLLIEPIKRVWLALFPMKNVFFCLFEYFGVTCVTIALALALGAALRKLCPPVFRALNGGR